LDFMGYYALTGYETDRKLKQMVRSYMLADIEKRREYIKSLMMTASEKAAEQLPHIMPDYMLVFSVPVLTHSPRFTSYASPDELTEIKDCLWFIMEPLIVKNDNYSFGFYKTLVERMKNHKDALEPDNEETLCKMYAICDIALGLILQRSTSFEMKDYPSEPRIPPMYFKRHDDPFHQNTRTYLPPDMQYSAPKKSGLGVTVVTNWENKRSGKRPKRDVAYVDEHGNVSIDAQPNDANDTRLHIPGIKNGGSDEEEEEDEELTPPVNNTTKASSEVSSSPAVSNNSGMPKLVPVQTPPSSPPKVFRSAVISEKESNGKVDHTRRRVNSKSQNKEEEIVPVKGKLDKSRQQKKPSVSPGSESDDQGKNHSNETRSTRSKGSAPKGSTPTQNQQNKNVRKRVDPEETRKSQEDISPPRKSARLATRK